MTLKARVKKLASPGRFKEKATVDAKEKPAKSDDENEGDKRSAFSTSSRSPMRVFLREQLRRRGSFVGSPKDSFSESNATTDSSGTRKSSQSKSSMDDSNSTLLDNEAPAVPPKDNTITPPSSIETQLPKAAKPPVAPPESPKIQTDVVIPSEKVSQQPSPEALTPETPELDSESKSMNGSPSPSPSPSINPKIPPPLPKRNSSAQHPAPTTRPITIPESTHENDEETQKPSTRAPNKPPTPQEPTETNLPATTTTIETTPPATPATPTVTPATPKTDATEKEKETPSPEPAGGIEGALKRERNVDHFLVLGFVILLVVLLVYNPLFDVPWIRIWG
ncbi:hypothetical protein FKW77_005987 [Venturia effusa]|uniref:Uncharacterized protein n=1 Tax=Venturia effusa TaxID=50376 RepID=A0A517LP58_9PEZI|nr:hypothetical protein FKW77_005987 [Venturia effusa]